MKNEDDLTVLAAELAERFGFSRRMAMRCLRGFQAAVQAAGSQVKLGKKLRPRPIRGQAVQKWRGLIPANRVVAVERATGVPRHKLRPDLHRPPRRAARGAKGLSSGDTPPNPASTPVVSSNLGL